MTFAFIVDMYFTFNTVYFDNMSGQWVTARGEPSRDLLFLLKGEVSVLSPMDGNVTSIVMPTEEVIVSKDQSKVMTLSHSGCFGESVLTGIRRQATHVAATWCETLVLAREDLMSLFEKNPRAGRRVVRKLLAEVHRKQRLQVLCMRFIIGSLPEQSHVRCALIIQKRWARYAAKVAAASKKSAASLFSDVLEPNASPLSSTAEVVAMAEESINDLFKQFKQACAESRPA